MICSKRLLIIPGRLLPALLVLMYASPFRSEDIWLGKQQLIREPIISNIVKHRNISNIVKHLARVIRAGPEAHLQRAVRPQVHTALHSTMASSAGRFFWHLRSNWSRSVFFRRQIWLSALLVACLPYI